MSVGSGVAAESVPNVDDFEAIFLLHTGRPAGHTFKLLEEEMRKLMRRR